MIGLKSSVCSVLNCGLLINDITGFKDVNNPLGFFTPGVDTAVGLKEYYIDDVYLFTYAIKNNADNTAENKEFGGNVGKIVTYDSLKTYEELMDLAGVPQTLQLDSDGYYSIYHFAIPKDAIKNEVRAIAPSTYYVKSDLKVYRVIDSVETEIDLFELLTTETTWSNTNISIIKTEVLSKCFIDACLSYILEKFAQQYNKGNCVKNSDELTRLKELRDMLFAVSNTIQYYTEFGYYYKAAKLIEDVGFCSICASFVKNTITNCNCNG